VIGRVPRPYLTVVRRNDRPPSSAPLPNLHRLRAFVVLAEELDVRRAATRLNVTPSLVCRSVKKLEGEIGAALFRRSHRRLELTVAGERLLPAVRGLLDAAVRLVPDLHRSPESPADFAARAFPGPV
jgi:DNA-binding transcriptional LysR family regulator